MTATQTRAGYALLTVPPADRHRAVRLTARGRCLLVAVLAALLVLAISAGHSGSQAATAVQNGPALTQATVQPGDTLWSVAQRLAPGNDPREVVEQLRRINHLRSSALVAGQQLLLPAAA